MTDTPTYHNKMWNDVPECHISISYFVIQKSICLVLQSRWITFQVSSQIGRYSLQSSTSAWVPLNFHFFSIWNPEPMTPYYFPDNLDYEIEKKNPTSFHTSLLWCVEVELICWKDRGKQGTMVEITFFMQRSVSKQRTCSAPWHTNLEVFHILEVWRVDEGILQAIFCLNRAAKSLYTGQPNWIFYSSRSKPLNSCARVKRYTYSDLMTNCTL